MLKPDRLFSDGMVLQQGQVVPVWGLADPGAPVAVTMQGQTAHATADAQGRWQALCGPFAASFDEEMTITAPGQQCTLRDVQVGEVWLAGGQSNMEFHMRYDADFPQEKETCQNSALRFFDYPEVSYPGQIEEADYGKHYAFWRQATPESLERFSAVGYYFAKELQQRYKVPVGVIGCNWGGTPAAAWMSPAAIRAGGGQVWLDEYAAATRELDLDDYNARFAANPQSYQTDLLGSPINDWMMQGCTAAQLVQKLRELGIDLAKIDPAAAAPPIGPKHFCRPGGLYESMVKAVAPYGIRGVIWYQGESDGDTHPETYETLFPALIADWRRLWGRELPFLFVQLAPFERWMQCTGERYGIVRAAQQHTADTVPGTAMAVTTDVGMQYDIHPKKKQPLGRRLALLAENKVYGEKDVLCEAPALTGLTAADGALTLTFAHAGAGLYLAPAAPDGTPFAPGVFSGVQVWQNGAALDAAALTARAAGNTVTLCGPAIRAGAPTRVEIAQTPWCQVNLYNSAGIPARPGCRTAND